MKMQRSSLSAGRKNFRRVFFSFRHMNLWVCCWGLSCLLIVISTLVLVLSILEVIFPEYVLFKQTKSCLARKGKLWEKIVATGKRGKDKKVNNLW